MMGTKCKTDHHYNTTEAQTQMFHVLDKNNNNKEIGKAKNKHPTAPEPQYAHYIH
jgi:hypothetical protein